MDPPKKLEVLPGKGVKAEEKDESFPEEKDDPENIEEFPEALFGDPKAEVEGLPNDEAEGEPKADPELFAEGLGV